MYTVDPTTLDIAAYQCVALSLILDEYFIGSKLCIQEININIFRTHVVQVKKTKDSSGNEILSE